MGDSRGAGRRMRAASKSRSILGFRARLLHQPGIDHGAEYRRPHPRHGQAPESRCANPGRVYERKSGQGARRTGSEGRHPGWRFLHPNVVRKWSSRGRVAGRKSFRMGSEPSSSTTTAKTRKCYATKATHLIWLSRRELLTGALLIGSALLSMGAGARRRRGGAEGCRSRTATPRPPWGGDPRYRAAHADRISRGRALSPLQHIQVSCRGLRSGAGRCR